MKNGYIHIYCGDGKGKTTSGIGLVIRYLGTNNRVIFAQFMKNDDSSEIKILKNLDNIHVLHGKEKVGFYFQMSPQEKEKAKKEYTLLFERVLEQMKELEKKGCVNILIVLDELISAYNLGMVEKSRVLEFLKTKPQGVEIVLTGRDPHEELTSLADYVSEIRKVRHPYEKGIPARKGIEC